MRFIKELSKIFLILITINTVASCATGPTMYTYSFSFDANQRYYDESNPVDILDYDYGGNHIFGLHPSKDAKELSETHNEWAMFGPMPRGDYLYVKWRVRNTGEIHEVKVDLTHRLPKDMSMHGLYFVFYNAQLYIFLFPPYKTIDRGTGKEILHCGIAPAPEKWKTLIDNPFARSHLIYPDLVQ